MFADMWFYTLGFMLVIFELLMGAPTGLDILFLGVALMGGGVVYTATGDWQYSLMGTVIVLCLYWFFVRREIKKPLLLMLQRLGIDVLVGHEGIVVTPISAHTKGLVQIDGVLWKAAGRSSFSRSARIAVQDVTRNQLLVSTI